MPSMFDRNTSWTTVEELANVIEAFVRDYDWVTFAELENHIAGLAGDWRFDIAPNVVVWFGSEELWQAIEILREQDRVYPHPGHALAYLMDGGMLNLPIAKRPTPQGYKKPRWLPVCLRVVPV